MDAPQTALPQLRKIVDVAMATSFVVVLLLPGSLLLLGAVPVQDRSENRALTSFPELALDGEWLSSFPAAFETWYGDHFGLRRQLIRWNNAMRVLALGASPEVAGSKGREPRSVPDPLARRFTKGKGEWFYTFDHDMMADYRGLLPYSPSTLLRWQSVFETRQRWLAQRGIAYLLVVVPDKHMVYPEFLPWNIRRAREKTRARQVVAQLQAHSRVPVLDLLPPLLQAKGEERLYNRTGTHWNEFGAYVGYREIVSRLGMTARPLSAFTVEKQREAARPFMDLIRIRSLLSEEYIALVPKQPRVARQAGHPPDGDRWQKRIPLSSVAKETGEASRPRALVFHDSFVATNLEPFLSEHFERIYYRWSYHFDQELVAAEQPDIVIEERSGRSFLVTEP